MNSPREPAVFSKSYRLHAFADETLKELSHDGILLKIIKCRHNSHQPVELYLLKPLRLETDIGHSNYRQLSTANSPPARPSRFRGNTSITSATGSTDTSVVMSRSQPNQT